MRAADIGHNDNDEDAEDEEDEEETMTIESELPIKETSLYHQRRKCKFYVEEDR